MRDKKVPSPDAIARFLKKPNNLRLLNFLIEFLNKQILSLCPSNNLTIDIDATLIESNKESCFYTYEKFKGYCPLLSFEAEKGLCLLGEFRDGNKSPSDGIIKHIKYIHKLLKKVNKIFFKFRSDSAAYCHEIFDFCTDNGILFSVTADHYLAVISTIKSIPDCQWLPYYDAFGVKTDREFAVTVHTMNNSKYAFSLIVQRWKNPQPSLFDSDDFCYHIIASNDFNSQPIHIIHDHNKRVNSENFIKEIKIGLGLESIPTNDTYSNSVYFAIGLLAYNLSLTFKLFLPYAFQKSTIASLRFFLISIPGKVVYHGRQLFLKIKKYFLNLFHSLRLKLANLSFST